jgi:hypothetical protein
VRRKRDRDEPDFAQRLVNEWHRRAEEYEHDAATGQAVVYRRCAAELDAARHAYLIERLSTSDAVVFSGYSRTQLAKLRREGHWDGTRGGLPRKASAANPLASPRNRAELSPAAIMLGADPGPLKQRRGR